MGLYSGQRGSRSKDRPTCWPARQSDFAGEIYNIGCERGISVNQLVGHVNDALGTAFDAVCEEPRPGDVRLSVADISPGPAQAWDTTRSSVSKRFSKNGNVDARGVR